MQKKQIEIECPICKGRFDLRKLSIYREKVRRAFFAGSSNKGIANILVMFVIMLAVIIGMAISLGARL